MRAAGPHARGASIQPFGNDFVLSSDGWKVARLVLAFLVDEATISRAGGAILEPLVFAAIVEANQAPLRNDPDISARYGDSGEAIPDELRRPISINAVAESLRLPFETVRRRTRDLIEAGRCVATPAGVYIPRSAIVSPEHAAIQAARFTRLMQFHDDLVLAHFLRPAEILAGPLPRSLTRTVNRALSGFMLRTVDRLVELAGGVMDGFVLLGLAAANLEAAQAAPSSAPAIARRLGLPGETVRRRLGALRTRGYATHERQGWRLAVPPEMQDRVAQLAQENRSDLYRLFARLKALEEAAGPAGPAGPSEVR